MDRALAACCLAAALLTACDGAKSEIALVVDTDVVGASAFRVVTVSPSGNSRTSTASLDQRPAPRTLVLVHRGGALGPVRATIDALDAEGHALVSVVRELTFEPGRALTLPVFLSESCRSARCPVVQTCGDEGECRPPAVDPCEYEEGCVSPADDASITEADGGACTLALCGLVSRYLPGDSIAPAACAPAEAAVTVTGPGGPLEPTGAGLRLREEGVYDVRLAGADGCVAAAQLEVVEAIEIPRRWRDGDDDDDDEDDVRARDIAARIGTAFVASSQGPFAVDGAGWHDLRDIGTGDVAPSDLERVAMLGEDPVFGPRGDVGMLFRVAAAAPFDLATHTAIMLPEGSREVRELATRLDGMPPLLAATKDGAVLITGEDAVERGPSYDSTWAAIGTRESALLGAVWLGRRDQLVNISIGGAGALNAGSSVSLPNTLRDTFDAVVDDRGASARLWLCTERGVAIFDLASLTTRLDAPIAEWDGPCRDLAVGADGGAWVATAAGLVRLAPDGVELARVAGIAIERIALASDAAAREVWMLDADGQAHVLSADALP